MKSKKIRDSAKGQDCTLRLFPFCDFNPETTVLSHLPFGSGTGQKSPDWASCYACYTCHGIIDGSIKTDIPRIELKEAMLRAHFDTMQILINEGLVVIK